MAYCLDCGQQVSADAAACQICGRKITSNLLSSSSPSVVPEGFFPPPAASAPTTSQGSGDTVPGHPFDAASPSPSPASKVSANAGATVATARTPSRVRAWWQTRWKSARDTWSRMHTPARTIHVAVPLAISALFLPYVSVRTSELHVTLLAADALEGRAAMAMGLVAWTCNRWLHRDPKPHAARSIAVVTIASLGLLALFSMTLLYNAIRAAQGYDVLAPFATGRSLVNAETQPEWGIAVLVFLVPLWVWAISRTVEREQLLAPSTSNSASRQ